MVNTSYVTYNVTGHKVQSHPTTHTTPHHTTHTNSCQRRWERQIEGLCYFETADIQPVNVSNPALTVTTASINYILKPPISRLKMSYPIFKDFDKSALGTLTFWNLSKDLFETSWSRFFISHFLAKICLQFSTSQLPDIFADDFDSKYTLKIKSAAPSDVVRPLDTNIWSLKPLLIYISE